ncbi:MAG: Holliday junction branch migration protein RuvA [Oscillospiraceae bacterium]|nr:Holliday junction branch migration protein RuvA [Oscillospiraceae bacterium]MBR3850255.1 Holliday junction branch migration protein RuvA [Oscillospiraceae bacterium]
MFYFLRGTVAAVEEDLAVIDCGGVGFACYTTAATLSKLKTGSEQTLYTHCNIREDAFDIFGFASREEKNCFKLLLGVSGVGPKAALAILSVLPPDRLTLAVMTGDEKALSAANGVGKKMAQRVILELKDKIGNSVQTLDFSGTAAAVPPQTGKTAEATEALAALGFRPSEIGLALRGIDVEALPVEEIVRLALRAIHSK